MEKKRENYYSRRSFFSLSLCSIVEPLTKLIFESFESSIFPAHWKNGIVNPLHKSGDKLDPSNYRPITLLQAFSKIPEHLVHRQLYSYLVKNKLLSVFQSGFIAKDSTTNLLLEVVYKINSGLKENKFVRAALLDFQKAFDNVNHEYLLFKLYQKGIRGKALKWIKDYLSNRSIQTVLDGHNSNKRYVTKGVPQGSVIGPLLFLVYIDDLPIGIDSSIKLFANDVILFNHHSNSVICSNNLNKDLVTIQDWSEKWFISLNPKKCESITFSTRYHRKTALTLPPLLLYGLPIQERDEVKYLGLILSYDLSWNSHVTRIVSKASSIVGLMKFHQRLLVRNTFDIIFKSCVLSVLNNAAIIYSLTTDANLNKLESMQYDASRVALGAMRGSSKEKCFELLGWIPLRSHFKILRLLFFAKIIKDFSPIYIIEHLNYRPFNSNCSLRRNSRTTVESTNPMIKDFFSKVAYDWHALVLDQPNFPTLKVGKMREVLKKEILVRPMFPKYLVFLSRSAEIYYMRIKAGFPPLNYYLYKHKCVDSPDCTCSQGVQNIEHYLLKCRLYRSERTDLLTNLNFLTNISVDVLLLNAGTFDDSAQQILNEVSIYIEKAQRFIQSK
ncbi:unnamed protein product [Didymodactylos carnosus]|uniref:Reverse transcriptase domain-containing protein n=1 Tax=Didymodactylos carnosus TaxID=1234261 RepID=A0A815K9H9_9BILA|nr:unnamed protein product [Didymodactylos carnosus]CAF4281704.1 unnamed protein product [Didymodactylos carnosus]